MITITITIDTDNAAFEGESFGLEVDLILQRIANRLHFHLGPDRVETFPVYDSSGHTVGKVAIS